MPISRDFFARHAVEVAPDLLGCVLAHQTADGLVAVELTEVEAYAGRSDPASHAYRGRTQRNAVMFGPPGHAYVYFTYGMHFCVNLVCEGEGSASAVLLRAGAVIAGEDLARARRTRGAASVASRDLARGPARLCQALDIDRALDGADVCAAGSPLQVRAGAGNPARSATVLARGDAPPGTPRKIMTGPRVGVSRAAEVPWRFWFEGEPTVSLYRPYVPRRGVPGGSPPPWPAPRKLVTP